MTTYFLSNRLVNTVIETVFKLPYVFGKSSSMLVFDMLKVTSMITVAFLKSCFWCTTVKFYGHYLWWYLHGILCWVLNIRHQVENYLCFCSCNQKMFALGSRYFIVFAYAYRFIHNTYTGTTETKTRKMLSMPDEYKVTLFQASMKNNYISGEQTNGAHFV